MIKNNKGFTLIELLAIVIILAIIMIIAAPNMTKEIKRSEQENQNILNEKINNAAHIYAAKYYSDKLISGESIEFSLNDLLDDGLINFGDNICVDEKNEIINGAIKVENGRYNYDNIVSSNCYNKK